MTKAKFNPMTASELIDMDMEEEIEWVWEDYFPAGGLVILAAKPKVGKSTLAYQLIVKIAKGEPFLERSTKQGGVLIVALEEHLRDVRLRLKELDGRLDNIFIHSGSLVPNSDTLLAIEIFALERGVNLIVIDTLAMFWRLQDESDVSAMTREIKPLLELARNTGACVVLIHHFRKSEGSGGDEIRGSIALMGAVDIALGLYPQGGGNRRELKKLGSRYSETSSELTVELKDGEYVVVDIDLQSSEAEEKRLAGALTSEPQDIESLAKAAGVPRSRVYKQMKRLVDQGLAQLHGEGVKGSPHTYTAVVPDSLSVPPSFLRERRERA